MNVKEFVDEFKKLTKEDDKRAFCKKHVVREYIPYSNKIVFAQKIADLTTLENGRLKIRTSLRHAFMGVYTLLLYTDIDLKGIADDGSEETIDVIYAYDLLSEVRLDEYVGRAIGEDYYRFDNIVATTVDDIIESQNDTVGWLTENINNWVNSFSDTLSKIDLSALENINLQEVANAIQKLQSPNTEVTKDASV